VHQISQATLLLQILGDPEGEYYLKTAYYFGLSSASPVQQTVALVWNVGYPMRTESPSGYVYAIENSPA